MRDLGFSTFNNSQFSYDGQGRCVQITENVAGTPTTLEFVWCGNQRCETRNGTGFGTVVNQFFPRGEVISGTSYFYAKDHLGSIRELTNSAGTLKAQYGYDPYGVKSNIITEVVPSDFQYAGYYLHSRSGLSLTRTRAYNATLGRFINRDPIGIRGGVNLYGYVGGNPISNRDPWGLCEDSGGSSMHIKPDPPPGSIQILDRNIDAPPLEPYNDPRSIDPNDPDSKGGQWHFPETDTVSPYKIFRYIDRGGPMAVPLNSLA